LLRTYIRPAAIAAAVLALAVLAAAGVSMGTSVLAGYSSASDDAPYVLSEADRQAYATDQGSYISSVRTRGAAELARQAAEVAARKAAEETARKAAEEQARKEAEAKAAAETAAKAEAERLAAADRASRAAERTSDPRSVARGMLADYGWSEDQFGCLDDLWTRESNWNHRAENPSSGAYGIPQSLPGDKMASAGSDWRTNPSTQIEWGLGYISDVYGSPCGAWSHSESVGWY
jgi:murein DD-endopeptidase MepM/ murein hydrolase activator NlpD